MSAMNEKVMVFPEISRYKPETAMPLLALYEQAKKNNFGKSDWAASLRHDSREALAKEGLPTPRLERWQYTNLFPQIRDLSGAFGAVEWTVEGGDKFVLSLGDMIVNPPEWLRNLLASKDPGMFRYNDMGLWHLGNLFLQDGIVIDVPAGTVVKTPLTLTLRGKEGAFSVPRLIIRLGEGAALTVVENHEGAGAYWINQISQIEIGPNARLHHYRLQDHARGGVYSQSGHVRLSRDSFYEGFTFNLGAAISRNQLHAHLTGVNAACHIYGVNLQRGSQHADTTVEAEHQAGHGTSSQFVRSVLDDQAHAVFQGKVYVHRGAQKTDGSQMSNALLISEGAEMDTRPELEIYADDVKCAHGATTGRLQDEPLFYLRSRGLSENEARRLLIAAFIAEVTEKLGDETVKSFVLTKADQWLKKEL